MMHYENLLNTVWSYDCSVICEDSPLKIPDELQLQALWFAGNFGRDFINTEGKKVRMIQFGEWNRNAGPDFLHSSVMIEDQTYHGALELDPRASDWETHGHATNANYDDVILHVCFQDDTKVNFTRTSSHKNIPRIIIEQSKLAQALNLPSRDIAIAKLGRCHTPLKNLSPAEIDNLLKESSLFRAKKKARNFTTISEVHGRDTALFSTIAQTLGYRGNSLALEILTQRIPLSSFSGKSEIIEPILFGVAGFLAPDLHEKAPEETQEYLRNLWNTWWKYRTNFELIHSIPWKMHGHRPANHPHRRLAALSVIIHHWKAFRSTALARPFSPKKVIDFLTNLTHPFWNFHHTLSSNTSKTSIILLGKTQILELIANHLAPLALQEDNLFTYEKYLKLHSPTRNEKLRRAGIRLFGSENSAQPWMKSLAHQQALLQIYHDFCLEDFSDCANCPFPEQLAQWKITVELPK
jgi:Protein of unknown function (DUF2851)